MDVRAALLLPTVVRLVPEPRLLASQGEPGSFERVETVHPHCVRLFVSTRTASDARKHSRLGKPDKKLATELCLFVPAPTVAVSRKLLKRFGVPDGI